MTSLAGRNTRSSLIGHWLQAIVQVTSLRTLFFRTVPGLRAPFKVLALESFSLLTELSMHVIGAPLEAPRELAYSLHKLVNLHVLSMDLNKQWAGVGARYMLAAVLILCMHAHACQS